MTELKNHIDILSGFAFSSKLFNKENKGMPLIRIRDVGKNLSKTFFTGDFDEKFIVVKGDFLIGMDGDFRLSEWKGDNALLNQRVCKIWSKDRTVLDDKYLLFLLPRELKFIEDTTSYATVKHLSVKKIQNIKIPLPKLETQKKIAAILDEADKIRQLNKQLIAKYDVLSQSLFLEMFGDPVTNPKGWKVFSFKDVIDIRNGKNQKKVLNKNGKYPIYGSGGIMDYADDYISDEDSVIIGRKGNINKPILVKEKYWHVDTAFGLNPIREVLNHNYLYFFCKRYNFEQHNKTVTIPSLTKATLLNVKIPISPINIQNQFAERLQIIENQKQQAQASLQKSEDLFNSLLQKVFKGELVKE
jgi:type I restriction enzyme S subunit